MMFHIDGLEHDQLHTLHPVCADVLRYWQHRAEDVGGIPKLADIDLMELWQHAGHIYICDAETGPETDGMRLRWRYAGSMLHELTGLELTGRYVDEVFPAGDEVIAVKEYVVRSGNLHFWKRSVQNTTQDWDPVPYECLSMPLQNDGGSIGHILGIVTWPDAGPNLHHRGRRNSQPTQAGTLVSHPGRLSRH